MSKTRILVIDDHIVVRMGLRTLIQSQPDMQIAGEGSGANDAVTLFESERPDVVLLDLRMPDGGGIEALKRIRAIDPEARVLMLSSFGSEEEIYQSLQAGALGYILKGADTEELLEAIRQVHRGNRWVPPNLAARYTDRTHRPELTAREMEVLKCIFHGLTNKEIAYQLGVAENTVKNHINNLMTKLNAKDRTQAAHMALNRGLLSLD
jgi:two-component system, NarL family, response regulator